MIYERNDSLPDDLSPGQINVVDGIAPDPVMIFINQSALLQRSRCIVPDHVLFVCHCVLTDRAISE